MGICKADSKSVFIVDRKNDCIRRVFRDGSEAHISYRCASEMQLQAVQHLDNEKQPFPGTLLVVESLVTPIILKFSLVIATIDSGSTSSEFKEKKRLTLSERSGVQLMMGGNLYSFCLSSDGKHALAANCGALALDIIKLASENPGECRTLSVTPLGCKQFCFAMGYSDLLCVAVQTERTLRIMHVESWEPIRIEKLYNVKDIECSRLAWLDGCFLVGVYEEETSSHRLESIAIKGEGYERLSSSLFPADDSFGINFLATCDNHPIIYDTHCQELITFEYEIYVRIQCIHTVHLKQLFLYMSFFVSHCCLYHKF